LDSPLTLACALEVEERAARKGGAHAARVGLGAGLPLPEGRLVAFGLAGALVPGLEPGTLLSARKVVDDRGETLWEGEPLTVPGALTAVLCASGSVVDDPAERRALAERTGAAAVDLESGVLAESGRFAGAVRAVSDTPSRPLGCLACAATPDGRTDWRVVARAVVTEPLLTARAAVGATRALASLRRAAAAFAQEPAHG
jgi:adenosylhomocysteine nucleosidase